MKGDVLFVCRENLGRSQIAMAIYNQLNVGLAGSAGTLVDLPGRRLGEVPICKVILDVMGDEGFDISGNTTRQVTPEMASKFGKIVVMAEPQTIPDWLWVDPKFNLWTIEDLGNKNHLETRESIYTIRDWVRDLAA